MLLCNLFPRGVPVRLDLALDLALAPAPPLRELRGWLPDRLTPTKQNRKKPEKTPPGGSNRSLIINHFHKLIPDTRPVLLPNFVSPIGNRPYRRLAACQSA